MADDSQVSQQQQQQQQETKTEVSELDYVTRREIGREAVWSLSSAKPGNGVDQVRDDSIETYWQSGGRVIVPGRERERVTELWALPSVVVRQVHDARRLPLAGIVLLPPYCSSIHPQFY